MIAKALPVSVEVYILRGKSPFLPSLGRSGHSGRPFYFGLRSSVTSARRLERGAGLFLPVSDRLATERKGRNRPVSLVSLVSVYSPTRCKIAAIFA